MFTNNRDTQSTVIVKTVVDLAVLAVEPVILLDAMERFCDERRETIAVIKEIMMIPSPPTYVKNDYSGDTSHLPVVGEIATLNHTGVYGNSILPEWADRVSHPKVGMSLINYDEDKVRMYDIISNIESDDPDVFVPHTAAAQNVTAEIGRPYTILAKVEVFKEGFISIGMTPIESGEDVGPIRLAVSRDDSIYLWEYLRENMTYLDHTMEITPSWWWDTLTCPRASQRDGR